MAGKTDRLYLIPFLHQTTTLKGTKYIFFTLYLIPFLHQTTTLFQEHRALLGCILFHFYIKPQPFLTVVTQRTVVSYSISTSNHNALSVINTALLLYLIPFLHQTTTLAIVAAYEPSCILFHFYIKPQPMAHKALFSSTLSPKSHSHFQRNAVV